MIQELFTRLGRRWPARALNAGLSSLLALALALVPATVTAVDRLGVFELDGNPKDDTDFRDAGVDSVGILAGDPADIFKFNVFGTDDIDSSGPDQDTSIFTGGSTKDPEPFVQWQWKTGDIQSKIDIHNAWAGTTVYLGPAVPATGQPVPPGTSIVIDGVGSFSAAASGSVTFVPTAGYIGEAAVFYTVCDNPGASNPNNVPACNSDVLTVTVAANPPGNDAPVAHPELIVTEVSKITDIRVVVNDTDLDGDALTLQDPLVSGPTGGSATIIGNTVRYTAPATSGEYSLVYRVCDPSAACDEATVTIQVEPDNDNRVNATEDFAVTLPNVTKVVNVLTNDTDPEVLAGDFFDFNKTLSLPSGETVQQSGLNRFEGEHLPGDALLYFGMDTTYESGNIARYAQSFWFLQDETVAPIQPPQNFWEGAHRPFDFLVQTQVGGSGIANARVFVWDPVNGGPPDNPVNLLEASQGNDCTGANSVTCTVATRINTDVPTGWPHFNPQGFNPDYFQPSKYLEGGVNLSNIFREQFDDAPVPCFAVMVAETRSSGSPDATLQDFLREGYEACSFIITKTGDEVVVVGDIATFTFTIENTGVLPLYLTDIFDPLTDENDPDNETALKAARAADCEVVPAGQSCTFQVSYQTSASDPDPLTNTVTATMVADDGTFFTKSDDHVVDLIAAGSVGDTVWLDEDGNGVFDAGEDGIANVEVKLYADLDGSGTVEADETTVVITGGQLDLDDSGTPGALDNGTWHGVRVIGSLLDIDGDGLITPTDNGQVTVDGTTYIITAGYLTTDGSTLVNATLDGAWDRTQTDADGEYLFTQLPPKTYDVTIAAPAGMDVTYDADAGWAGGPGTPDDTTSITLAAGEKNLDADFGLNWVPTTSTDDNAGTGAIGDRIWSDDGDGIQEPGEPGIAGVIVRLLTDDNGDGIYGGAGDNTVTTTTDASGNYIFDDLDAGAYVIEVDTASLEAAGVPPGNSGIPTGDPDGDGDNTSDPIVLAPGDVYLGGDWGYSAGYDVTGSIYLDAVVDGDSTGEAGLYGITVNLVDSNGNIVATATTEADGTYTFTGVLNGTYTIEVGDTAGVLADMEQTGDPSAGQTGDVCKICDGVGEVTVASGDESGFHFGYVPFGHVAGEGLISGSVGLDVLDPNDQVDPNEELEGIEVTLFELYDIIDGRVDFDRDGDVSNDPDDTGAIFVDDDNDGVLEIYCVFVGLLDTNCDHTGVTVTGGLLDANNDGVVNGLDDGVYSDAAGTSYIVKNGYLDMNGDGLITDADDGTVDGVEVNDGWFDVDMDFVDLAGRQLSPGDPDDATFLDGMDEFNPAPGSLLDGYDIDDGLIYYDGTTTLVGTPATPVQLAVEIDSTTTDASGFYAFDSLRPNGEYRVALQPTTYPDGTTIDFDYGVGATNGVSDDIDLGAVGGIQTGVDFGLIFNGANTLSGTIWKDVNADGTLSGESGIEGVTVELYDCGADGICGNGDDRGVIATAITDSSGNYSFGGLADGTYTVKVTDEKRVLTGYWLSDGPNDGADDNSQTDPYTVILSGADNTTADFGYYIDPATVGNTVFKDLNGDGLQQLAAGETGFSSVLVELTITYPGPDGQVGTGDDDVTVTVVTTTDASGNYTFGNLLLDEDYNGLGSGQPVYSISVSDIQPALIGYLSTEGEVNSTDDATETLGFGIDGDADNADGTAAYPVQGGTDNTNDFGFALPSALFGTATGLVWLDVDHDGVWDAGEPGIDEVTVFLYADRDGDGVADTSVTVESDGVGAALDLNGDGVVDEFDDGFWYGVEVIDGLLDTNGDGKIDGSDGGFITTEDGTIYSVTNGRIGAAIGTVLDGAWDQTITDANGNYSFDDLPGGDYQVLVDPDELLSGGDLFGLDETAGNIGGTATFNMTPGETEVIKDLGYVPNDDTAVIEGNVFSDANANGFLNGGEVGIGEVTVNLFADNDGDGVYTDLVATTTTGPDGQYIFTNVPPGDYVVQVDTSDTELVDFCDETAPVTCNTNATTSAPITVDIDDTVSGVNFGFDNPADTFTVTDTIFDDFNGDGDCEFADSNCTEDGIGGVTVNLYDCGPDFICGSADDVGVIATVVTDDNGDFSFDGVPEGYYQFVVTDNNGVLDDYYETTGTGGIAEVDLTTADGDGTDDINGNGVVDTVGPTPDDGEATFGYRKPGTISGSVYSDSANFGTRDDAEAGFGGVVVELYDDLGNLVATTLTAADGSYSFEYLDPGSYKVVIMGDNFNTGAILDSATTAQTGDPDQPGTDCSGSCDNQTTTALVLGVGESIEGIDFGYNKPALSDVSGTVFNDYNENAVHEPDGGDGDPGTTGDNETGIAGVTVTLSPEFEIYDGLIDLDGDPGTADDGFISGSLNDVEVIGGLLDINGDGVVDGNDNGTFNGIAIVGGYFDVDGDGIVGAGETAGHDNGSVVLDPIATAITDANGDYIFKDVPDGNYVVAVSDEDNVVDGYTLTSGLDERAVTADSAEGDVTDIDFGYVQESGTASIGDTVWLDDGDGILEPGESGISGVLIKLYDSDGNLVATTTTDANGNYLFDDLPAGDYTLVVDTNTLPADLVQSVAAGGFDWTTGVINLSEGEEHLTADIGYKPPAGSVTLGDRVWYDADGDGLQDPGEVGLEGVEVIVFDPSTGTTTTYTTDEYGNWWATLPAGRSYTVYVNDATLPEDVNPTPTNLGDGDTYVTPVLDSGDVLDYLDFGFTGGVTGAIGDTVWLDSNGDGIRDPDEPGLANIGLRLISVGPDGIAGTDDDFRVLTTTTDTNGEYLFSGLQDGDYYVELTDNDAEQGNFLATLDPTTGAAGTNAANGETGVITLADGETYLQADFGYVPNAGTGVIGDFVWSDADGDGVQDEGEIGLGGVRVFLDENADGLLDWTDADGDGLWDPGEGERWTYTDPDGSYWFTNLAPGDYTVVVDTGTVNGTNTGDPDEEPNPTPGTCAGCDSSYTLTVIANTVHDEADFGYYDATGGQGVIGDYVYLDYNADGDCELVSGSCTEPGVAGVTINLYDGAGNLVATTTTDASGFYEFSGLPAGDYSVEVTDTANVLAATTATQVAAAPLTIVCPDGSDPCTIIEDADFGFAPTTTVGAITGSIWWDDDDGTREAGEASISGVQVNLLDANGNVVATAFTDADGNYRFNGLPPGDYTVDVVEATLPDGYAPSNDTDGTGSGANASAGQSGTITVAGGGTYDANFAYVPQTGTAIIGDTVWSDDGDGVQEAGEAGIGGVTVDLYDCNNGTCGDGDDVLIDSTVTAADGSYEFSVAATGTQDYAVIVDTATLPADYNTTPTNNDNSDTWVRTNVVDGAVYNTLDWGFDLANDSSISGTTYGDIDGDGTQDAGEAGIAGVTVSLQQEFVVVDGRVDLDRSGSGVGDNGTIDGVAVIDGRLDIDGDGSITEADDGLFNGYAVIDGFIDLNGNGVDDPAVLATTGDPADDGLLYVTVATTTTNANGDYTFDNLPAGEYRVDVSDTGGLLSGLYATEQHGPISLGAGVDYTDADFGFAAGTDTGTIGDFVYFDANGNGTCDPVGGICTDDGISGVTLALYELGPDGVLGGGDDTLFETTTTGPDGSYLFTGLSEGLYQVVVTDQNNVVGDLLPTEQADYPILIACGTTCTDVSDADFGYEPTTGDTGNIGGTVWHDTIQPGGTIGTLQDDESGIGGVEVELWLDVDGDGIVTPGIDNLVRTTITDTNGDYNFLGVPVGDYIVVVPDDTTGDVAGNLGTNEELAGMTSVLGPDPTLDSNGHQNSYPVTLTAGETDTSVDFAYVATEGYSISGLVYEDADGNGSSFDSETDALAEDAVVTLYRVVDGVPVLVATTTTDNAGYYEFLDQPAGYDYVVEVDTTGTVVDGLDQTVDYDEIEPDPVPCTVCDGVANIINLTGNRTDVDFGYWNGGVITTPVTLSYFEAQPGDEPGVVRFEWATSTEAGNVGFDLYAVMPGGKWQRLNGQMVASQPGLPTQRRSYSFVAHGVEGETFYIVDIDMYTKEVEHGPFALGEVYGVKAPPRRPVDWQSIGDQHRDKAEQRKARKQDKMKDKLKKLKDKLKDKGRWSGQASAAPEAGWAARLAGGVLSLLVGTAHAAELPVTDNGLLRFEVAQAGLHRVAYEDLAAAGLDLNGADPDLIGLTRHGEPVPLRVAKDGKGGKPVFGPDWYIEFVADGWQSLYSTTDVYTLYLDDQYAARMTADGRKIDNKATPAAYYLETLRVESEAYYNSASPTADPWYMDALNAFGYLERNYAIELDAYAGPLAEATVEVGLWGGIDWPDGGDDHHVQVRVNGELVADRWFDGVVEELVSEPVPAAAALAEGTNTVTVAVPMDTGFFVDFVNLNHYALTYPRQFVAQAEGALRFTSAGRLFDVTGLDDDQVVVVRRRATGAVELVEAVEVVADGGGYRARFNGIEGELCEYFVHTVGGLLQPALAAPPEDQDITTQAAQYLVIAHPDFIGPDAEGRDALAELALERQADGYTVQIADLEQVYAQFGYGLTDPQAIGEYLKYAAANKGTELVLLVGGDTYDYHDYLGLGAVSFMPSLYAATGPFTKHAPVDPKFTDLDGDDVPDLAIGRFPVRSSAELGQIVDKTLAWEVRDYSTTSLFAADGFDAAQNYDFKSDSEDMLARLPAAWQAGADRAYIDDLEVAASRQLILDRLNRVDPGIPAVALTSFVGHSGPTEWTFDGLFNSGHAAALMNFLEPTIVTQWGCWNTYYVEPQENTLAHEFLLNGEQGAAAVLGASTLTEPQHERELAKKLFDRLFQPGVTLGEAILQAKQAYVASAPADADVILGWTLLGDPALVLAE